MMPSLPQLPTDSLYKFMALLGVAMVIAAPILTLNLGERISDTENTLIESEYSVDRIGLNIKLLEIKKARLERETAVSDTLASNPNMTRSDLETWKAMLDHERAQTLELEENADSLRNQQLESEKLVKKLKARVGDDKQYFIFMVAQIILLFIDGWGFTIWGRRRWYKRIQRYQDMILEKTATASGASD